MDPWSDALDLLVTDLFELQCDRTPDAVALRFDTGALTYRELNARANEFAFTLRRLGVVPEARVCLYLERSPELIAALLGVLKAGGVYVPLDPAFPQQRLQYMIDDSSAAIILTQADLFDNLKTANAKLLLVDHDITGPYEPIQRLTLPDNLAYILYTSGSTGRPKGVQIPHRAVMNFLRSMQRRLCIHEGDLVLATTTISFDIAALEIFLPICAGACVELLDREVTADPSLLKMQIARSGPTMVQATPAAWRMLVEAGWQGASGLTALCGGEALPIELAGQLIARCRDVWNLYGPTETTIWSAAHHLARNLDCIPIGRPIENTCIHVLDKILSPVPLGSTGELFIGGAGLARGYWNRSDLTADRFVPDPFGAEGSRLYRTGDLGRMLPDGSLEFVGRVDHQVKVNGFRIEPGEIETVLSRHKSIQQVVVVVREDASGTKRLAAYIVPRDPEPTVAELRKFAAEMLPYYMIPSIYIFLSVFPLTANAKVDRGSLPPPETVKPTLSNEPAIVGKPLETMLAAMWCDALGVTAVGLHDDFFDLGGTSILAATFLNALQRRMGQVLYITSIFEARTVAQFASYLERHYADSILRLSDSAVVPTNNNMGRTDGLHGRSAIDRSKLLRMHRLLEPVQLTSDSPSASSSARRNHPALFILSPPRAGSTLLRVMLAGHPSLFAPPELELAAYPTLRDREFALGGKHQFAAEGLLRGIMELNGRSASQARQFVQQQVEQGVTTPDFYAMLQNLIGDRVLVDKTSTYAMSLHTLRNIERWFRDPLYIHLVRSPGVSIDSYLETRLDRVFRWESPFPAREEAELLWVICHHNILTLLTEVPKHRYRRIRFEDLVRQPRDVMLSICGLLGLEFHPDMIEPYKGKRMTDGLHAGSRMHGDPKFHQHTGIDPAAAEPSRSASVLTSLSIATQHMAAILDSRPEPVNGTGIAQVPTLAELAAEDQPPTATPPAIRAAYIGGSRLFSCLQIPARRYCSCGVLLCYPMGREYIQSHAACRQLTDSLAAFGFPVMRFDYSGSGDSAGECADVRLDQWLRDIQEAAAYLQAQTAVEKLSLVGFRLGAALATLTGAQDARIDSLVLWNPVIDGASYVRGLMATHEELLRKMFLRVEAGGSMAELLGFPFPRLLREQIEAVSLLALSHRPARYVRILSSPGDADSARLSDLLRRMEAIVDHTASTERGATIAGAERVIPATDLHAIVEWLRELYL